MLHLTQTQRQQQKLTPAQVQYLKILQLPIQTLEQRIKDELELNPLLEEGIEEEENTELEIEPETELLAQQERKKEEDKTQEQDTAAEEETVSAEKEREDRQDDEYSWEDFIEDNDIPGGRTRYDDDEDRDFPAPALVSMTDLLVEQMHMLDIDQRLVKLGEEILGNIDEDGYLRRKLDDLVLDVNHEHGLDVTLEEAEQVLYMIQRLDPPGIGSRDLRECLLAQIDVSQNHSTARIIARRILVECYDQFVKKHFDKIRQDLHIGDELMKKAFEYIRHLNPKPGEGTISATLNYVIPDFFVEKEKDDYIISLNDRGVPPLRVSRAYREMLQNRKKRLSTEARKFVKDKMDSAKWFIQSISQRRQTMLAVMNTIVEKQRDWFDHGPGHLKPMIYRDIADVIGMDISTISRVVNGKYAQTEWGVFELRYFFSEGIPTADGVEVSNTEVKSILKEIISVEDPKKPLSDEALMKLLRTRGFDIARRTVAKYREALGIPVSRLRVKI